MMKRRGGVLREARAKRDQQKDFRERIEGGVRSGGNYRDCRSEVLDFRFDMGSFVFIDPGQ